MDSGHSPLLSSGGVPSQDGAITHRIAAGCQHIDTDQSAADSAVAGRVAAMMQPTFLPWLGYFALIRDADTFVFLDDFQYVRRSYHNRNRMFRNGAEFGWMTVPVAQRGAYGKRLCEVRPQLDDQYFEKFWKNLSRTYGKCPFFDPYAWEFMQLYRSDWASLSAMNEAIIRFIAEALGFSARFVRSSTLSYRPQRSLSILDLLPAVGATTYLSASGSYEYMVEDGLFAKSDVTVLFQDFRPTGYPQVQHRGQVDQCTTYLSAFDALLQIGPEATVRQIQADSHPYRDWAAMARDRASGACGERHAWDTEEAALVNQKEYSDDPEPR